MENSRYRHNNCTIFDVFCEVGVSGDEPVILQKYPEDFTDEATLKSIRQFSFPYPQSDEKSDVVQLFSFVLTDAQSQYTFGYCRYTPRNNTCVVMLTGFPWHGVFYQLLNHVSVVMNESTQEAVDALLTRIYHTDIPNPGENVHFESVGGSHPLNITVPDLSRLPCLREDKFMLEFFNAVTARQMIAIYASLLKERRIIFTGRKLSQLSSCIHAAATLLYPMHWQYLFIPVLPRCLQDMLQAPMPFLIGVPKQVVNANEIRSLGDVMIVDLEEKTLHGSHDDTAELPTDVLNFLKSQLKSSLNLDDSLSRAFLRANIMLFGGYRIGLTRNEDTQIISWDKEKFLQEQRPSHQAFLGSLFGADGVQYIERFITERLTSINKELPINDVFEQELVNFEKNRQAVNPEVFQQAVLSVKENANDVIGAIKERMTSIQIRDKFGKLTAKDIRRSHSKGRKKLPKQKSAISQGVPISFENLQWSENANASSGSSRGPSPAAESHEVPVGDLIDLDDDAAVDPLAELDPLATSQASELSNGSAGVTSGGLTLSHGESEPSSAFRPVPAPRRMFPLSVSHASSASPPVPPRGPHVRESTAMYPGWSPQSSAPQLAVRPVPSFTSASTSNPFLITGASQNITKPSTAGMFVNPYYAHSAPSSTNVLATDAHPCSSNGWEKFE